VRLPEEETPAIRKSGVAVTWPDGVAGTGQNSSMSTFQVNFLLTLAAA